MDARNEPPLETLDPLVARSLRNQRLKLLCGVADAPQRTEDLEIPGPAGKLRARIYSGTNDELSPALIYFHGGGFIFGDLDTHDPVCRSLARQSGAKVISVEYRLAPEHKFPAAVEDAYAATLWVFAHAESLGIDARRIAVGGDSAGGNLAAVVAIRCRDQHGPRLAAQLLIYPIVNCGNFDTGSYRLCAEGYGFNRPAIEWCCAHYLASADQAEDTQASPLLTPDLRGLPAALIVTAEFDPLRDEGEAYAERLRAAGVRVALHRYAGMIHGFVTMRGVLSSGRDAIREAAEFVRAMNA